jgi:hypothetical protein
MTFEEAVERKNQLNAKKDIERRNRARARFLEKVKEESEIENAYLPSLRVSEFENKLFRDHSSDNHKSKKDFLSSKVMSHWRAVKAMILDLAIDPKDYEHEKVSIYKYFSRKKWSLSYTEKLIMILNKWGNHQARIEGFYYLKVPFPFAKHRDQIDENYHSAHEITKESDPLTLKDLSRARRKLRAEHYKWIFVSFWFGLRPMELDRILMGKNDKIWKITTHKGCKVLNVYQAKLRGVKPENKWKLIPAWQEEQKLALKYIKEGKMKRPLVKTIKKHVGERFTTYAGRKGFESLMLDKGVEYETISSHLGHTTVDRTWKSYRNKNRVMIPERKKAS